MLCSTDIQRYKECGFPYYPEFDFQFIYWIEVYSGDNPNKVHRWTYYHTCGDYLHECDKLAKSVPLHPGEKISRIFRCTYEDARWFMMLYNGRIFTRSQPYGVEV